MIGSISYEELSNIIDAMENSNNKLKDVINKYQETSPNNVVRMTRFTNELDGYINYLKNLYEINKKADEVLEKIRELNK